MRTPSTLLAARSLVAAWVLCHREPAVLLRRLHRRSAGARPATYAEALLARERILLVSSWSRGERAAHVRSVAVALLCRAYGRWPVWCLGLGTAAPYDPHTWVEAEGRIVDGPVDCGPHRAFLRITPDSSATVFDASAAR